MARPSKPSRRSNKSGEARNSRSVEEIRRQSAGSNTVRIIGGRWRRRKLQFPPIEGLRPTPDRIRETVFNWLAPHLAGAKVLDAYCGSGVLGLESLSRGAKECVFVDSSRAVQHQLEANIELLDCTSAQFIQRDFLQWLAQTEEQFDLVFLDPPYDSLLLQPSLDAIEASACLTPGATLYLEHPVGSEPLLTDRWSVSKALKAGSNRYCLLTIADAANH